MRSLLLIMIISASPAVVKGQGFTGPFSPGMAAPFPSDVYTTLDETAATGLRINFSEGDLRPELIELLPPGMRPEALAGADGFSAATPMTLVFKEDVDHKRLPRTPEESISDDAPIKLLDVDTGGLAPYVVHVPVLNPVGRDPLSFVRLYPFAKLTGGHRYVLYATDVLPMKKRGQRPMRFGLFERLFTGAAPANDREARIFERLSPYLAVLEDAGVDRERIIMITGFTIRTDENANGAMVRAGQAVPGLPAPAVTFKKAGHIPGGGFRVDGIIRGPAIIDDKGKLQLDGNEIRIEGDMDIPFVLFLPPSAKDDPASLVLYCQGGPPAKRKHYYYETLLRRYLKSGIALLAIDSPSNRDLNLWRKPTRARTSFPGSTDPAANTAEMAQWAIDVRTVVSAVATGGFDVLPLKNPDHVSDLDPERIAYTGISYGGINGVVFTSFEPRFIASVIQVGGTQWIRLPAEHMMADLQGERGMYPKGVLLGERPFWLAAAQLVFDLVEPSYYMARPIYPGAEQVPVFTQSGYHDTQVLTSASMNAVMMLEPTPGRPFSGPLPHSKAKWYGGPLYPNGHVAPILHREARNDRLDFMRQHLKN